MIPTLTPLITVPVVIRLHTITMVLKGGEDMHTAVLMLERIRTRYGRHLQQLSIESK